MRNVRKAVTIRYDRQSDAAYINLVPTIAPGAVVKTHPCDPGELGVMIAVDFDAEGRMLGIEVMDASSLLPRGIWEEIKIAAEE
jgi:uncharacterized protein YuzE